MPIALTLFCPKTLNCTGSPFLWESTKDTKDYDVKYDRISKHPKDFIFLHGNSTSPPCSNSKIIEKFKIKSICIFLANISEKKESFLKLMKYTKQSPVYLEDSEEYYMISSKYGYYLRKDGKVS